MAGLAPQGLRLPDPSTPAPANDLPDIIVEIADEGGDTPEFDQHGAVLKIEHGDGSVTVSLDGRPLTEAPEPEGGKDWFANLATDIPDAELSRIAEELMRGIQDDIQSRSEWVESVATGIQLLGLKIEIPGLQGAADGAPVEGMSKVRHPLLLEAVLRFQANARSELLPTDGPVKVRNDSTADTAQVDRMADELQEDLNHYLTTVATEYYPDTDRMLFKLGFAGIAFKKVYFCPLRMRPVSETVPADDLIVNNSATDLSNSQRVTHRINMKPSTVRRMQILGVYRDIDLSPPMPASPDAIKRQEKSQQGVEPDAANPDDRDREIYECYCELEIQGHEHKYKGKVSGLPVPYRVTIDVTTRQVLSVVRNYDETDELPTPRKTFVAYIFVPGFGFYAIGLLHILGNTTNAITAAWREMLDNGMFANFPGFLISKSASRQNSTVMRVAPGSGTQVDTAGMKIGEAVMPLPYNTQQMPALMSLVQDMAQTGQRIGGTSEMQVGEGRADAPVGTTLAMIEQATKVLNSVHKRMHAAQAEEFQLLVECFREHPESFLRYCGASSRKWTVETFLQALNDCTLVPQADPNTASHAQRVMKILALKQLQQASPTLYDPIAIDTAALQAMGWSNPEQFFAPPEAQAQPPPELLEIQTGIKVAQQTADAKTAEANAKVATAHAQIEEAKLKAMKEGGLGAGQVDTDVDRAEAQIKATEADTHRQELALRERETLLEDHNRDLDRASKERLAMLELAKDVMDHPEEARIGAHELPGIEREIGAK